MAAKPKKKPNNPAEPSGSAVQARGESASDPPLNTSPAPVGESSRSREMADRVWLFQTLFRFIGEIKDWLTEWLTHDQTHMRVLGWIVAVVGLGLVVTATTVMLFRWDPLEVIGLMVAFTGVAALPDVIRKIGR
jgi:hypothetical protein